jgi:hypothetical protein
MIHEVANIKQMLKTGQQLQWLHTRVMTRLGFDRSYKRLDAHILIPKNWYDMLHQIVTKAYFSTYLELAFFVQQILKKFCYEDQIPAKCSISLQDSMSLPG